MISLPFQPVSLLTGVGRGPAAGSCKRLMTYADLLITPFSYQLMSGAVLPSIVVVRSMSVGRAPSGSNGFQVPSVLR